MGFRLEGNLLTVKTLPLGSGSRPAPLLLKTLGKQRAAIWPESGRAPCPRGGGMGGCQHPLSCCSVLGLA